VWATLAEHVILRTAWVLGVHGNNFVKTMLRLARERDVLRIVDDQRGSPTPAAAVAAAIVRIAERIAGGDGRYGTFHFAGMPATTCHRFARVIFERQRGRVPELVAISSDRYPVRARRPRNSELCLDAIWESYGIPAPVRREGLAAVLDELGGRA
jgi:dTDP-4-dehydrorhamnose reductase